MEFLGTSALWFLVSSMLMHPLHIVHGTNVGDVKDVGKACNFYEGRWVFDESYHSYNTSSCPFIQKQFDCQNNGRPDTAYLKYRWQPSGCSLPSFDGRDFLERLEGKKLMFVGDSLSLNQWQSLTCMLHVAVPQSKYTSIRIGGLSNFSFPEYNVDVMFSRNAFLVDIASTETGAALKLDSISSGELWKDADVLIFNSWHWWLHTGRKQPWDYIQEGNATYKDMDRLKAYEKALNTWARWIDSNLNPATTEVFFQGVSPDHSNSNDWGEPSAKNCDKQTRPYSYSVYPAGPHPAEKVAEKVLSSMEFPVKLLDVTTLSQFRKDGHPSVYGHGGHRDMDCSHWCLAGVPDAWNRLLYATFTQ